jgi:REP element-mobilizing transposase RayT
MLRSVYSDPLAYFLSFRTYGTWLHGDERGSVDRTHNEFGSPLLPTSEARERFERSKLKQTAVELGTDMRACVDRTLREVCEHKRWKLLALNVRSNHVHVVVAAAEPPESVMNAFKAWATRRLAEAGSIERGSRVWSRHGSTIYQFKPGKVDEKCAYVQNCQ